MAYYHLTGSHKSPQPIPLLHATITWARARPHIITRTHTHKNKCQIIMVLYMPSSDSRQYTSPPALTLATTASSSCSPLQGAALTLPTCQDQLPSMHNCLYQVVPGELLQQETGSANHAAYCAAASERRVFKGRWGTLPALTPSCGAAN